jgi:hypothetical protein
MIFVTNNSYMGDNEIGLWQRYQCSIVNEIISVLRAAPHMLKIQYWKNKKNADIFLIGYFTAFLVPSNSRRMDDKLERIWNEVVVA